MGIEEQVEATLAGLGYELVEFRIHHSSGKVCVFIDNGQGITLTDCESVTRQLEGLFAAEGFDYGTLEVSSPGLDRRLTKPEHYRRFAGCQASVTLKRAENGEQRKFKGVIGLSKDMQSVVLECDEGTRVFALNDIELARLKGVL